MDDVRENQMSDAAAAEESYGTGRTWPLKGPCAVFGHCRLHRTPLRDLGAQFTRRARLSSFCDFRFGPIEKCIGFRWR